MFLDYFLCVLAHLDSDAPIVHTQYSGRGTMRVLVFEKGKPVVRYSSLVNSVV